MTIHPFILEILTPAQEACAGTKIYVSVCIAQAILETGWGKASVGNNLFGIKAAGKPNEYWDGSYLTLPTYEYIKGVKTQVYSKFRKYRTKADSIKDHNRLFKNKRYAPVLVANNPEAQARAIQACGYATDPKYADKLITLINKYNLKQFEL